MAMHGALHPKSDGDRLYIKTKEGGKGLMSVERYVREEKSSEEKLIRGYAVAETINIEDTVTSAEFKKQKTQELKQNWREKKMHVE